MKDRPELRNISEREVIKAQVRGALEDSRYRWRTLQGMTNQLQLNTGVIITALDGIDDLAVGDRNQQEVFTTRDHWRKTTPWWERILIYVVGHY